MGNVPITLSLPEHLVKDLHLYISRRQISKFVAQMIAKGIEARKEALAKDFREAALDTDRNKEIDSWDNLARDGLDESSYLALKFSHNLSSINSKSSL